MGYGFLGLLKKNQLHLDVLLCTHCNLKCRYCCRWSNISKKEFYDFDKLKTDLLKLKSKNIIPHGICLTGGEPLLHPNINEIIIFIKETFNCKVTVLTNGKLLLRMNNDFLDICEKYNVEVVYSQYYCTDIDYPKIVETYKAHNINIQSFTENYSQFKGVKNNNGVPKDRTKFFIIRMTVHPTNSAKEERYGCMCDNTTLWRGKLWLCSRSALVYILNDYLGTKFDNSETCLELDHIKSQNDIMKFFAKTPNYCAHCLALCDQFVDWSNDRPQKSDFIK